VRADVVIWATGNVSGIDTLALDKDGVPFSLRPNAKLYNHFVVPDLPVLASSTALWTTFGPMRATNAASWRSTTCACAAADGAPDAARADAPDQSQQHPALVHLGAGLLLAAAVGALPRRPAAAGHHASEAFLKHALEIFVLAKETPLRFNLLPRKGAPAPVAHVPAGSSR
jgi:hypothetical protein